MSFIPGYAILVQFAIATFIIAITPGPDMTLFVGRALSKEGVRICLHVGAMSGIVIHTALVAFGLSALIVASPQAFLVLKVAGAAISVWLAFRAVLEGLGPSPSTKPRPARSLFQIGDRPRHQPAQPEDDPIFMTLSAIRPR